MTVRTVTVPCLVGTVVEVSTKDKKKKEEDKSLILGQCCVDLLPILTGEKQGDKVRFALRGLLIVLCNVPAPPALNSRLALNLKC